MESPKPKFSDIRLSNLGSLRDAAVIDLTGEDAAVYPAAQIDVELPTTDPETISHPDNPLPINESLRVPDTRKLFGRIKAIVHRNRWNFSDGYYEEPGTLTSRSDILLGFVQAVEKTKSPILKSNNDVSEVSPVIQSEDQSSKYKNIGKKALHWLSKKVVQTQTATENIVETVKKHPVGIAAIIGGVAVTSAYMGYKYGVNKGSSGNTISQQISDTIINNNPKPPASINRSSEWYSMWVADHPGASVEQFNDIINSQSFADMCNNPDQFDQFAGLPSG